MSPALVGLFGILAATSSVGRAGTDWLDRQRSPCGLVKRHSDSGSGTIRHSLALYTFSRTTFHPHRWCRLRDRTVRRSVQGRQSDDVKPAGRTRGCNNWRVGLFWRGLWIFYRDGSHDDPDLPERDAKGRLFRHTRNWRDRRWWHARYPIPAIDHFGYIRRDRAAIRAEAIRRGIGPWSSFNGSLYRCCVACCLPQTG